LARTIDLELTRAEVEVRELEARLRVVPMNDSQLSDALRTALAAKKERLDKLRALHAAGSRQPVRTGPDGPEAPDALLSHKIPTHGGHRTPLKRTVPQRPKAAAKPAPKSKTKTRSK
jgi:hypothetical protein